MHIEQEKKIIFSAFLTVVFNLILSCIGIIIFAVYYAPGNPIRSSRMDVNLIGLLGASIGISQFLYIAPILVFAFRTGKLNLFKGVVGGSMITVLLNIVFLFLLPQE